MSSYDEHLITQAGGDGEPSASRKLTEHQALCIWEDNVGDSGKAPTNLELLTFANAARDPLLALVRDQQARIDRSVAYCEQAASRISTDPEVGDYERGFDDSTRGMSARIRAALEPTP